MAFKKRIIIPPLIVLTAIILLVLMFIVRPQPPQRSMERPPVLVDVVVVQPETVQFKVYAQGNVQPKHMTNVVTQVSGQVVEVSEKFVNGGFFMRGEVLLRIDPADYRVAVQNAKASLAQARAALAEESARAKVAKEEWEALQVGEIPPLGIREPQVASALAAVQSAEAALEKAERDLERTVIRAPFDGILQNKTADIGQFLSINSPVATLYGSETAEVRIPLSDRDLAYIDLPDANYAGSFSAAELTSPVAGLPTVWHGHLIRSEGVLDQQSRVIYGVIEVDDPYNQRGQTHAEPLRFGRFVEVAVDGIEVENVIRLPRYALLADNTVWVVDDEHRLQRRTLNIIRAEAHDVIIDSGLSAGDRVVLTQLSNALPSMKVRIAGETSVDDADSSDATVTAGTSNE